ncbi:CBS domain-containing protein [Rhodospira trueperi]|uniref:CBS domain-containing protein n=1 Tax=Rhodospira trueperi TaxID=69960 RepID=A0A1G7HD28_9PROT|nr:CBS domain-containing protein [Rhodospira trueperi]SDE98288.1 CBS domain-containing protein [Rhodospira trueperi]
MLRKLVPEIVNTSVLISVAPDATARDAAVAMATHTIAAVLVMDGKRLVGIITERDITARVVAIGRDPANTRADEIMTPDPHTLSPEASANDALDLMQTRGFRHLPIVDGDRVVSMVSMRDLHRALHQQMVRTLRDHGGDDGTA